MPFFNFCPIFFSGRLNNEKQSSGAAEKIPDHIAPNQEEISSNKDNLSDTVDHEAQILVSSATGQAKKRKRSEYDSTDSKQEEVTTSPSKSST